MIALNFPASENILRATGSEKYWIHTEEHGRLLETLCGNTAFIFGFNNRRIIDSITAQQNQLSYLVHTNYTCDDNERLIKQLCTHGNFHGVSYAVSGTDGVECAVAINDYYWTIKGQNKSKIVSFSPGYHGITYLARAMRGTGTIKDKVIVTQAPSWLHLAHRQYYETSALHNLKQLLTADQNIGAVIMESIPWFAGLRPWSEKWWLDIRAMCTEHAVNLIIDDVMGGMGKLGPVFSHSVYGIQPDIAVLGKSLTGGYSPLSVACTSKEIADTIKDTWEYGHTWQPNMMGVAAALTALTMIDTATVNQISERLCAIYDDLKRKKLIDEYLVAGLMSQLSFPRHPITPQQLHQNGLTCNFHVPEFTSLMLCTPMIADDEYFVELETRLTKVLE